MNRRVLLKSFHGTTTVPADCRPGENYWLLIGERGTIVAPLDSAFRRLVRFDVSLQALGLHGHNPIENSLQILVSDLQFDD